MTVPHSDMAGDAAIARVFGRGCDDRYRGKPRTACPYSGVADNVLRTYWLRGWDHMDKQWASDIRGRSGNPRWNTVPPAAVRNGEHAERTPVKLDSLPPVQPI